MAPQNVASHDRSWRERHSSHDRLHRSLREKFLPSMRKSPGATKYYTRRGILVDNALSIVYSGMNYMISIAKTRTSRRLPRDRAISLPWRCGVNQRWHPEDQRPLSPPRLRLRGGRGTWRLEGGRASRRRKGKAAVGGRASPDQSLLLPPQPKANPCQPLPTPANPCQPLPTPDKPRHIPDNFHGDCL
jgi:hypothetical protein